MGHSVEYRQRHMAVNNLPRVVNQLCRDCSSHALALVHLVRIILAFSMPH